MISFLFQELSRCLSVLEVGIIGHAKCQALFKITFGAFNFFLDFRVFDDGCLNASCGFRMPILMPKVAYRVSVLVWTGVYQMPFLLYNLVSLMPFLLSVLICLMPLLTPYMIFSIFLIIMKSISDPSWHQNSSTLCLSKRHLWSVGCPS